MASLTQNLSNEDLKHNPCNSQYAILLSDVAVALSYTVPAELDTGQRGEEKQGGNEEKRETN